MGTAGGHVRKAQAHPLLGAVDAAQVVVAVVLEHAVLNDGAGGDHTDHVPLDQALGQGGVLHLLADGHLVPFGDQARHVAFVAVERHAAHGGALFLPAVPAGQGQFQFLGREDCVVVEHFVEVAQPEEQNLVLMLFFQFKILRHHGGKRRHAHSPS